MRYILLKSDDFEMFHQDIDAVGYEFYHRHKEAFRRMYNEQGKEFWVRFALSFRSAQSHDFLHILKGAIKHLSDYVDSFFINVHEEFIEGPFSRAKQFFEDIAKVVEDQGYMSLLQSRSVAKNPFHKKDTKDIYRRFFGSPVEIKSYSKVFILLPLYRRFAGSLCVCLRRWLEASELTDLADKSYWVPPPPAPVDKVKDLPQNDGLKTHESKKQRVDILKLTVTKDNNTAASSTVDGKEDCHACNGKRGKVPKDVEKCCNSVCNSVTTLAAGDITLNKELVDRLSSLFQLSHPYLGLNVTLPDLEGFDARPPKKPGKGQPGGQSNGYDERLPASETRGAPVGAPSSVRPAEKEMLERLQAVSDCGDFDSFGIRIRHRSTDTGKSKIELKISAARKEPGVKQIGEMHNGGTAEIESQETNGLETKVENKSNINKESSASTMANASNSKTGKETGVVKELKPCEGSECRKKTKATGKSDAKQELKATGQSDSRKKSEAIEESDSRQKVDGTHEDNSRKKTKITEESKAKQKFKATEESSSEKEAKVTVDEPKTGKGTDDQEEKELSRPDSKNVRTCMTCGLQEPAPKVFKKCKRCKDEDCPDPPYYCGRACQVLDWTGRHRKEHEKSCA